MKGRIITDWSKLDFSNPVHLRKLTGALNHFYHESETNPAVVGARRQLHHFTTKGDFPAEILQVLEKFHQTADWDAGYQEIYDIRDFTGSNESGFEILDVSSGLTFDEIPIGDKIQVRKMSGAKTQVNFVRYGGALGWDRGWLDDRQYWNLEDTAIQFQNKSQQARAQFHYDLIDAIGASIDLAWQAVDGSVAPTSDNYLAMRDTNTLNEAAFEIIDALKDLGLGITSQTEFIILAPLALKPRIMRALAQGSGVMLGGTERIVYNFRPIFTHMLASNAQYYVVAPKKKIKGGNRMNLTVFSDFDILAYADTTAGWMRFGAGIGEVNQFRRCATA